MTTCRQCGATLAEQAHYCMQCGTPVGEAPEPSHEPLDTAMFLQPALIGGLSLGLLSSIPIVNLGNCVCCMWVIGGGALAAGLLGQQHPRGPRAVTYGDGAFVGVLSGFVGAVIATLLSIPLRLFASETIREQQESLERLLDQAPEIEGSLRELILRMLSPEISPLTLLVTFFQYLLPFALFAMIGGILFVAILGRQPLNDPRKLN